MKLRSLTFRFLSFFFLSSRDRNGTKWESRINVKTDKFISLLETNQPQTVIVDQRKSEAVEKWWRLVFQINMNPDLFRMETNQLDVLAEP